MLIKIFKNVGKGSSRGPISYLLGKDKDGKQREPAPVELNQLMTSEGSKDAVAFLIDNNKRANKYTSGVIAFRDNEKLRPMQIQEIIKDFRKTFLPGLDENNVPVLWVMHREKGNTELHFLVPKMEATTGKAFNIAPPGPASQKLFEDFQKLQNDKLGFKQVTPNLLKAQFDTFEKGTRKEKISSYLVEKVKANEIHNRADLLRHLQHKLKWKVSRIGNDFISVIPTGKTKPIRLKGSAFTAKADYRDMLKQSSNHPTKLNPDEILKIDKSLQNGIKARTNYNLKNYINPPSYKNRGLNFKSKTPAIKQNIVPKVPMAQHKAPLEGQGSSPQPLKSLSVEFSSSTHTNTPPHQKNSTAAHSGPSLGSGGSSGSGTSSIDAQITSDKAQMNSEKNPARRAQLHTQLLALQVKKDQMLLQQHNDRLKQLNKIKP